VCLPQIHDNAGLLELPSEREAHVRRAGGESRSDTVGDGQPGVRGLRAAAAGHAAHQSGVVRRKRPGQFRRVISRSFPRTTTSSDVSLYRQWYPSTRVRRTTVSGDLGTESRISISHDYIYIVLL